MPGLQRSLATTLRGASVLSVALSVGLAGCATSPYGATAPSLQGTTWVLESFQSMDDAQGTQRAEPPEAFTLQLLPDGRVAMRLDCNRGTANWSHTPSADGWSGSINFSPVAATRALCAPPRFGERLARDLPQIKGYLLRDGKLYLSLMADAGIYAWRPLP